MLTFCRSLLSHWFVALFAVLAGAIATPSPLLGAPATDENSAVCPNIVLVNVDDLGYGDLSCYGATQLKTPNIDKLASEGRRFTDAHSPSSVCSPSRYGLITGTYPLRKDLWGPLGYHDALQVDPKKPTLANILKRAGYSTACVGKWHVGISRNKVNWNEPLSPGPNDCGFDYFFGIACNHSSPPFVYVENDRVVGYDPKDPFVKGKTAITQKIPEKAGYRQIGGAEAAHRLFRNEEIGTKFCDKAVEWIGEQSRDKPYFLYLATINIHHPYTPAKRFEDSSRCGRYGDFLQELDWIVGEVLEAIEKRGDTDRTLVILTGDNGGMFNVTGQKAWKAGHRLNGPLLGFKFGIWEGGHRVPMMAKWPGKIPAGSTSDRLIGHVDLLNTFAAVSGQKTVEGTDSLNQLSELLGEATEPIRTELVLQSRHATHLAIRSGDWVYIPAQGEGGFSGKKWGTHLLAGASALKYTKQKNSDVDANGKIRPSAPKAQLYNLKDDLSQTRNVHDQHPEIVKRLKAKVEHYRSQIGSARSSPRK